MKTKAMKDYLESGIFHNNGETILTAAELKKCMAWYRWIAEVAIFFNLDIGKRAEFMNNCLFMIKGKRLSDVVKLTHTDGLPVLQKDDGSRYTTEEAERELINGIVYYRENTANLKRSSGNRKVKKSLK